MLEAVNVKKKYGDFEALKGVSFTVEARRVTGLVGPNGSGKTTLIRLLVGITRPTSGTVRLFGMDPYLESKCRERVGYIPERPELPSSLPIYELLRIAALIHRVPRPLDAVDEALHIAGLEGHEHKRFDQLSAGLKQRAAIAHALIHEPSLIIADEPTSNLDPVERMRILSILSDLNRKMGLSIFFTSHVLAEVSRLAEKIIVLLRGRVAFKGTPKELVERSRLVRIRTSTPETLARLVKEEGYEAEIESFSVLVRIPSRSELPRLLSYLASLSSKVEIFNIDTVEASLEELLARGGKE